MTTAHEVEQIRYRVGIDVGTHSTGFCAIEIDDADNPIRFLDAMVLIHDSGVDPGSQKTAATRLAVAGLSRRMRRMYKRRKLRLRSLDAWIESQGWPLVDLERVDNPYYPWLARVELATERVSNPKRLNELLSVALCHMARHRGWRNPYSKVSSLYVPAAPSKEMLALRARVEEKTGRAIPEDATPAQLVAILGLHPGVKLRGPEGELGGKLWQSDNATELRQICQMQGLSEEAFRAMINVVFAAQSPKGSALGRVGRDALPGQGHLPRALKADEVFQEFRIVSVIANLRVLEDDRTTRRLSTSEQSRVIDYLMHEIPVGERPTWADVAEMLGLNRNQLKGTASVGLDGERPSSAPPVNVTDMRLRELKIKKVVDWWNRASAEERHALIVELSDAGSDDQTEELLETVNQLIESLNEDEIQKLSGLILPAGRAAYSADSMRRLARRMADDGVDLTAARIAEFGVAADWVPPADPIGYPVGNPAVDRVTKQVARWIAAAESRWGMPVSVNIEHVRSALGSEAEARRLDRENNQRYQRNQKIFDSMQEKMGNLGKGRRSDLTRYLAIQRQNCKCAYCGSLVDFSSAEMDHIIPRRGTGGSTNSRNNLVAVCHRCNAQKSNIPFAVWASDCNIDGVSIEGAVESVRHWIADPGVSAKDHSRFKQDVIARLRRTESDPEFDSRSMESVAWMARELHSRIAHHFARQGSDTAVAVYQGRITAEARKASGLENRMNFIGGSGKTRFDRRHHAMDAATIALLTPGIAKTLAERTNLRASQQLTRENETWKQYEGATPAAQTGFRRWTEQMLLLSEMLNIALNENAIPVMQNLRLRLGNSRAHEDTIKKFAMRSLSAAWTVQEIDRASTPALWSALTRLPDFDPAVGLPENAARSIRVNGTSYGPLDVIPIFQTGAAAIAVRGGYCELGAAVHHARVYRIPGKKPTYGMIRVYTVDLARHRQEDLFSVELPPQSISMRTAEKKIRAAVDTGAAEYLGWIVVGDEIEINAENFSSGQIGDFAKELPSVENWCVDGFPSDSRLRLRPAHLAAEGLPEDASKEVREIVDRPGWRPSVNVIFGYPEVSVIRRNALGEPRLRSGAGLPICWMIS